MAADILNHINGIAALTITGPVRLKIYNQNGTEIYPTGQVLSLTTATFSSRFATNSTSVLFANMPSQQVVNSWIIYDSSPIPKAVWRGVFKRIRTVPQGDTFEVLPGELRLELE
jgi:hypothetical protein